eukprot:CAMPEP_0172415798 /NCGR_PEP_ID=MMETSP1064-20121228/2243_1 /TAXON_ID=202472 /ORGANISM="Aulacoseira subarctica , Strain CCAP 1002/5" /LENGTH=126 /DNA_ID=CAMNT_0013153039 /DNA_START=620 /DNA_END=1000 /DNA_ORIENTATION=-
MNFFDEKRHPDVPEVAQQPAPQEPVVAVEEPEVPPPPVEAEVQEADDVPDLVDAAPDDDSDGEEDDDDEEAEAEEDAGIAYRTRQRTGTQSQPPARYTMVVKVNKKKETDPKRKKAIEKADKDEIE